MRKPRIRPQWHADWHIECNGCDLPQRWVDGNTAKRRYVVLKKEGWRRVSGVGWICPECVAKRKGVRLS